MNSKNISYVLAAIIVAMLLFPPFVFRGANGYTVSQGYGFVLSPPKMVVPGDSLNPSREYPTAIDTPQLFTQIFAVAIIGGIFLLLLRRRENK